MATGTGVPISGLPDGGDAATRDLIPVVRGGVTRRANLHQTLAASWAIQGNADAIPANKLGNAPGLDNQAVSNLIAAQVADWAETGDVSRIPVGKLPNQNVPWVTQSQVDVRVRALVEDFAEVGSSARLPVGKLPNAGVPWLTEAQVDGRVAAGVYDWAENNNADLIPADKLSNAPGLTEAEVDARVDVGVETWAHAGNQDEIPAEKLQLAPGALNFLQLTDTPAEADGYAAHRNAYLRVNPGGTAVIFSAAAPGTGGVSTFVSLTDGPGAFSGHGGQFVRVNSAETALEYADAPAGGGGSANARMTQVYSATADGNANPQAPWVYPGGSAAASWQIPQAADEQDDIYVVVSDDDTRTNSEEPVTWFVTPRRLMASGPGVAGQSSYFNGIVQLGPVSGQGNLNKYRIGRDANGRLLFSTENNLGDANPLTVYRVSGGAGTGGGGATTIAELTDVDVGTRSATRAFIKWDANESEYVDASLDASDIIGGRFDRLRLPQDLREVPVGGNQGDVLTRNGGNYIWMAPQGTGGGLTQSQVDARIESWARAGNTGAIPAAKLTNAPQTYRGDWNGGTLYAIGDVVRDPTGGRFYISVQGANLAEDPATSTSFWRQIDAVGGGTPPPQAASVELSWRSADSDTTPGDGLWQVGQAVVGEITAVAPEVAAGNDQIELRVPVANTLTIYADAGGCLDVTSEWEDPVVVGSHRVYTRTNRLPGGHCYYAEAA